MVQVGDLETSLAFYRDTLGLEEAFRLHDGEGRLWIAYLHVGGGRFVELMKASGKDLAGVDRGSGYTHMCLLVDNSSELLAELRGKGVTILSDISLGKDGSRQFWIKDPDGNRIELMEYTDQSRQRQFLAGSK